MASILWQPQRPYTEILIVTQLLMFEGNAPSVVEYPMLCQLQKNILLYQRP